MILGGVIHTSDKWKFTNDFRVIDTKIFNFHPKLKELRPHKDNGKGDFIHGWYIDDKVCDDVIEYFNEPDPEKQLDAGLDDDEPNEEEE